MFWNSKRENENIEKDCEEFNAVAGFFLPLGLLGGKEDEPCRSLSPLVI